MDQARRETRGRRTVVLRFKNRDKDGMESVVEISMTSVSGGIVVDVTREVEGKKQEAEAVLLTPMDAASFISDTIQSVYVWCRQVGHGKDGICLDISRTDIDDTGLLFVGGTTDAYITVGRIVVAVPAFVVNAMRLCAERMMESLFFPSTGSEEEEFG